MTLNRLKFLAHTIEIHIKNCQDMLLTTDPEIYGDYYQNQISESKQHLYQLNVNSMSDLFHERVKNEWIDEIFKVMEQTPQHTYQILTKRPDRMLDYILSTYQTYQGVSTPVRNIWLGSSIEHQDCLDDRIPALTKLNKRGWTTFYSCEPLLESVDLHIPEYPVSWVIAGGESGHGARPCHYEWLLDVVEQCQVTNTPVFVKQQRANYRYGLAQRY